jgi:hypothetical protein
MTEGPIRHPFEPIARQIVEVARFPTDYERGPFRRPVDAQGAHKVVQRCPQLMQSVAELQCDLSWGIDGLFGPIDRAAPIRIAADRDNEWRSVNVLADELSNARDVAIGPSKPVAYGSEVSHVAEFSHRSEVSELMPDRYHHPVTNDRSLSERADELDDTVGADHALVAGIAALNAVPVIGGVVATFISEYVPRRKQARLVGFVQDLGRQFDAEGERIDAEFVRSSEFDRMVEDVLDRVQQVKNEDKLGYWAALLAGVATRDRPAQKDRERMIETLDGVRPSNLRLLHVIATTRQGPPDLYMGGVSHTLKWKMPDVSEEDIRRDWNDLARFDLVQNYPSGMMTAEGAGNLTVRMTDYGRRFVRLLSLEAGAAS